MKKKKEKDIRKNSIMSLTLIEILIVVVISAGFLLFSYLNIYGQLVKVRDIKRKFDLDAIKNAVEQYYDNLNCYPKKLPNCSEKLVVNNTSFIETMPCDPKLRSSYIYETDGSNCSYWFRLYTNLEYKDDPMIDSMGCRFGCGPQCQYNYGVASSNTYLEICHPTPTITPILAATPTSKPTSPTPTSILYVCGPGGGQLGSCEPFEVPTLSLCPTIYPNDPTCQHSCWDKDNRCKDSKGKYKPTGY